MSIIIPSNKKGLEEVREEVEGQGREAEEALLDIASNLREIVFHLRIITGQHPNSEDLNE